MEQTTLLSAFSASLGIDNEARSQSHDYLQNIRSTPGLIPQLLHISLDPSLNLDLRQVSVIYLKNLTKNWKDSTRDFILSSQDKDFLKDNLINGLSFSVPEKIRSQYEEIAHNITKIDFPWNNIFPQISAALDNPLQVYAGLNMIYQISKNYEYVMNERRNNLLLLVSNFFDKIFELLKALINNIQPESYSYIQLILQIFWVSFYIDLPQKQADSAVLEQWMDCFRAILKFNYEEIQRKPESEEEEKIREKLPQWMCKKWAGQIVHRFFTRYFNLAHLRDQNLMIGRYFQANWAAEFFKIIIPQLFQVKILFIPNLVLNYFIKYTTQAIKFQPTFELLDENSVSLLLVEVIMTILLRVKSDDETWRENPIEFIRKEADMGKAYYSPRSSAADLLMTLCEKGMLIKFYEYVSGELATADLLKKEALLLALGSLSEQIKQNALLKVRIEGLLSQYVFPEFTNQIGFLRSRAAWTYARFAFIQYETVQFKVQALEAICALLVDPELPVRFEAALSLPKLLQWEVSKQRLSTELKNLLEIYLKLMNEIDSEDIVDALESIVLAFPKEVKPFSLELTQHLASAFIRMIAKDINEDEGESAMAAVSTLNTISKIIDTLEDSPEELIKISFILTPIFEHCLNVKGCDYFEESLNLLTCLLYYSPEKSLPHLYYLIRPLKLSILGEGEVKPYALEHIDEVFSPIANYIKKYPDQTLQNLPGLLDISFTLLKYKEQEAVNGCKILITILENYKGLIDQYIENIVSALSVTFSNSSFKKVRIACSQALFVALWNSPRIILTLGPLISPAFQFALASLKSYAESLAKSHMIFGLGSLFFIIPSLPADFQTTLPGVFKSIIMICLATEDDSSFEAEETEDGAKIPINIDDQCKKILEKIRNSTNDDDEEDDSFRFGMDAEDLYDSPFEVLNQNDLIRQISKLLIEGYPEVWKVVNSVLSEQELKYVAGFITTIN